MKIVIDMPAEEALEECLASLNTTTGADPKSSHSVHAHQQETELYRGLPDHHDKDLDGWVATRRRRPAC